jgi:hypothetical protein
VSSFSPPSPDPNEPDIIEIPSFLAEIIAQLLGGGVSLTWATIFYQDISMRSRVLCRPEYGASGVHNSKSSNVSIGEMSFTLYFL